MTAVELEAMLTKQSDSLFFLSNLDAKSVHGAMDATLERIDSCFSHIRNKYYDKDKETVSNPLYGCQYAHFLYYLANKIYRNRGKLNLRDRLYALLKGMSSVNLFYQVELPEIFFFGRPLATVTGRPEYLNYSTFSQGCTVSNNNGIFPRFGESVFMMSNSKVIGNCKIGKM